MFEELDFDLIDDQLQGPFRHARDGFLADPELMEWEVGAFLQCGCARCFKWIAGRTPRHAGRVCSPFEEVQGNGGAVEHRKAEAGRSNQTLQNAKARGWSDLMLVTVPGRRPLP